MFMALVVCTRTSKTCGAPLVGNTGLHAMIEHHATLYADLADPVALLRGDSQAAMAGYWPYAAVDAAAPVSALSPERVAEYSRLMSASQPLVAQEVLAAYDFRAHRRLLDVGGGEGRFLAAVSSLHDQCNNQRAPNLMPSESQRGRGPFARLPRVGRSANDGVYCPIA